jgi:hypothetical protein
MTCAPAAATAATVKDVCNAFRRAKRARVQSGELSVISRAGLTPRSRHCARYWAPENAATLTPDRGEPE